MLLTEIIKKVAPPETGHMRRGKDYHYNWNYQGNLIGLEFIYIAPNMYHTFDLPNDSSISVYEVNFDINGDIEKDTERKPFKSQIESNLVILNQIFSKIYNVFVNTQEMSAICFFPYRDGNDFKSNATAARDILRRMHEFAKQHNIPTDEIGNDYRQIDSYIRIIGWHIVDRPEYRHDEKIKERFRNMQDEIRALQTNLESKREKIF